MSSIDNINKKPESLRAAAPALIALCLAMLVEMLDNTVFTVAMPVIGKDLHANTNSLQWITVAYSLTFGGLLMLGGTLGDFFGRRRALLIGMTGFALSSSLVMFCSEAWHLIAIRAVVGSFAALMAPGSISLIFRLFDDDKLRGKAIGIVTVVAMSGFALGPILSGVVIQHLDWRILLLMNLPVAIIAIIGVLIGIPKDTKEELRKDKLDIFGAFLTIVFFSSLLYSFTAGTEYGWLSLISIVCYVLVVIAAIVFVWHEKRVPHPLIDLKYINASVRGNAFMQMAAMLSMAGLMYSLTLHLQYAWGWSPLEAGFGNLPFILTMMICTPITDILIAKFGQKKTAIIGMVISLIGLCFLIYAVSTNFWLMAIGIIIQTAGVRFIMTTAALGLIGALPDEHTSVGSAMNDTAQEVGNSIGIAVISTVIAIIVSKNLPAVHWTSQKVDDYIHAEQIGLGIIAGIVAIFAIFGIRYLTNSKETEEH